MYAKNARTNGRYIQRWQRSWPQRGRGGVLCGLWFGFLIGTGFRTKPPFGHIVANTMLSVKEQISGCIYLTMACFGGVAHPAW